MIRTAKECCLTINANIWVNYLATMAASYRIKSSTFEKFRGIYINNFCIILKHNIKAALRLRILKEYKFSKRKRSW